MKLELNEILLCNAKSIVSQGIGAFNSKQAAAVLEALVGEIERIKREVSGKDAK